MYHLLDNTKHTDVPIDNVLINSAGVLIMTYNRYNVPCVVLFTGKFNGTIQCDVAGGGRKPTEDPLITAVRELKEESRISIQIFIDTMSRLNSFLVDSRHQRPGEPQKKFKCYVCHLPDIETRFFHDNKKIIDADMTFKSDFKETFNIIRIPIANVAMSVLSCFKDNKIKDDHGRTQELTGLTQKCLTTAFNKGYLTTKMPHELVKKIIMSKRKKIKSLIYHN
jgi:hypothetical protein